MTEQRSRLGMEGERLAERFLKKRGMKTLERRFSAPVGEIDLVMREGQTLVFVEVKTRCDDRLDEPEHAVNSLKQRKLAACARYFVHQRRLDDRPCRFDIVAVVMQEGGKPRIRHISDAFVPERW